MIEINGSLVTETYVEYAVEPWDGTLMDCDSKAEAEQIAAQWQTSVLSRRIYVTEWSEVDN